VERDGVTVIPAASVRLGLGGGAGRDASGKHEGDGGGAMGIGAQAGYVELKKGRSRFVSIVHPCSHGGAGLRHRPRRDAALRARARA
jgi:hypothetical protein